VKTIAQRTKVRVFHREPLDPRQSALIAAGFMINKTFSGRIVNRVIEPNQYFIMYVLEGTGWYEDPQNGKRPIKAGDVILTFPGLPHSYSPDPTWNEAYLALRGPIFAQLEKEGLLNRNTPVISPGIAPALVSSVSSLVNDFVRERPLANPVETARVHMVLAEMVESHRAALAALPGGDFMSRACALLDADLEREIDFQQIAERFGFGYERFRKLFAEESGVSPARYRILRRIDRAKTLLMQGRIPLKSIAEQLGYCDVYFFARQFKQVTGNTPSEFRRFQVPAKGL
jgi:AraC-like DNA-binding protein